MSKNFEDLFKKLKEVGQKTVSVAVAQDKPVLEALKEASRMGMVNGILVGNEPEIRAISNEIDFDLSDFIIVNEPNVARAALEAVRLVSAG